MPVSLNWENWQPLIFGFQQILIWMPAYLAFFCVLAIYVLKDRRYLIGIVILLWFISLLLSGIQVLPFIITTKLLIFAGLLVEKHLTNKT